MSYIQTPGSAKAVFFCFLVRYNEMKRKRSFEHYHMY